MQLFGTDTGKLRLRCWGRDDAQRAVTGQRVRIPSQSNGRDAGQNVRERSRIVRSFNRREIAERRSWKLQLLVLHLVSTIASGYSAAQTSSELAAA